MRIRGYKVSIGPRDVACVAAVVLTFAVMYAVGELPLRHTPVTAEGHVLTPLILGLLGVAAVAVLLAAAVVVLSLLAAVMFDIEEVDDAAD